MQVPGRRLALFRIAFGLDLDMALIPAVAAFFKVVVLPWIWVLLTMPQFCFAFCGAGRIWGLDAWVGPALERRARAGAGWGGVLRLAA